MFEQRIKEKKQELIEALLGCIKINSVQSQALEGKPFGEGPYQALAYTLDLAERMGFATKNIDNAIGYAEYGQGDEMIAVLGHLDIVPIGKGWDYDPFGELCGDRIYGRGALDDKGPMIGALYALDAVRHSGLALKRRVRIIFGTNEETGSQDVVRYNKTEEIPVMGFTPDADYPVIFSEKGMAEFTLEKKLKNTGLISAKAGTAVNLVPDGAEAEIQLSGGGTRRLEASGISAHASTPEQGENAISQLMKAMENCGELGELGDFVRFYNRYVGRETDGQSLGIACETKEFGATTVNAGLLEGDEHYIKATFDCRYPWGEDFEKRLKQAEVKAAEYGISLSLICNTNPLYIPKDSQLVSTLQQIYQQKTGNTQPPMVIGGGTYAKSMKNIVAFGPVFPDQENVIHQKNEYISINHLIENVEIMAEAIYQLAR